MISQAIKSVVSEIAEHVDAAAVLRDELHRLKTEQFFTCTGKDCGKRTKVKSVPIVRKHYYNQTNTGSGSYWTFSENQIVCPKCNTAWRCNSERTREFVDYHSGCFREVVDWYPSQYDKWGTGEELVAMCREKK